jgi:glycosyltransferase involved in cell wall biosynthesis
MERLFMERFKFHVVSLPHTQVTKEYLPCAYTQKIRNFCIMMKSLGHEVILYASEDTDIEVDELVTCITKEEQQKHFGHNDWKKDFFDISWDSNLPYWQIMNNRAALEIKKRAAKKDFVALIGGYCQKPIADQMPEMMSVEIGIGYKGVFSPYKVFESYAWMHYVYGLQKFEVGQAYDSVIPNYFDPNDFPFSEEKEDYFLFIGRMITRKGAHIAAEATGRMGMKLKMAGQGVLSRDNGILKSPELELSGDHLEHVGTVGVKERGELMSKAKAVFVLTQYIGPFEGVAVEAMMSGTPIITTDWGCFTEYNIDGVTGFRTRTLAEIMEAMKNVDKLDYAKIREYAINNFSMDRVKYQYQAYFEQLYELWKDGWYSTKQPGDYKRYQMNRI